jgi:CheY-like chemotaxis protein
MPRRYDGVARAASGVSRTLEKIGEIQEVPAAGLCDDLHMARTVLVVDDHPSFRRFACRLLRAAGFSVVDEAGDGASALAAARRHRPDVVLLDVLLPDTTGFEVAEQLAADPGGTVVVLTSSRDLADLGGSVERSGARGFIAKEELTASAVAALVGEAT